jgi:hypothetical protein
MSTIRFLHTDHLRLASPVAGLSDSPDWLRKVASSAVRTAVVNVMEAAIAGRCQFLVVAGRLTESDQDLDLALAWLMSHAASLREHGVRLVLAGYPESEHSALRCLDAILLAPGQRLDVWNSASGTTEWTVNSRLVPARSGALGIEFAGAESVRPLSDLAYVVVPSTLPSSMADSFDGVAVAHDRHLRMTAGSPQSLGPVERGHFGCQMVEADLHRQAITSRFCSTDVIRFSQELISLPAGMPASQLCEMLCERSRTIGTSGRCTTVVEWVIDGHLSMTSAAAKSLCLNAGHSGAWPCRIRFSDSSSVDVAGHHSAVANEFSAVVRERLKRESSRRSMAESHVIGLPLGCGSEAAVGLDLLRRVA